MVPTATADPAATVRNDMLVTTNWLSANLHDPQVVVLCIAANRDFYTSGHVPGARYVPIDMLAIQGKVPNEVPPAADLKKLFEGLGINKGSRIVLYGEKNGMYAARAYFVLDYAGLAKNAALLDGGIEKWRAENRIESTMSPAITSSSFMLKPNEKVAVGYDEMKEIVEKKKTVLIDARPLAEFTGEKLSEDVTKAGHIPGAVSIYWKDLLTDGPAPVLRPAKELETILRFAGAAEDQPVVTYCRTGMQASFLYFVAKYLGFPTRMYTGSFYEWSKHNTPVEKGSAAASGR